MDKIHKRFESQAEKTPDAIAVSFADQVMTYAELNQKANQLAYALHDLNVGPDSFVGLCIERSLEMVVAVFGILKAGGAYIPLDPKYPPKRLSYMLENSEAPVLLTQSSLKSKVSGYKGKIIYVDEDGDTGVAHQSVENPDFKVASDNLIYVIYTSGSTGKPKGAMLYHKGFSNLLEWYTKEFAFNENNRTLLMTSFSFDLTQKNIYAPLISGGTLYLLETQHYDAGIILQTIARHEITSINCTPSSFYGLISDHRPEVLRQLSSLKYVFLGGEPIAVATLQPWIDSPFFNAQIVNSYGPTECTDVCAYHVLRNYEQYLVTSVPIGKPVYNTQLHILGPGNKPVPNGKVGELCIAGIGVGAGYLKQPEKNKEAFVKNPFKQTGQEDTSDFLYRTGDRVRYRDNGDIEYLGRKDHQVKIRGYRIELGEIETKLAQHDDVRETVVIVREDTPGEKQIVAYIVPEQDSVSSVNSYRRFLQTAVPDFMLPTAWVFLDQMPLNPNGKVDREALPAPNKERPKIDQAYVKPQTDLEKYLAAIWCELLGFEKVGIKDRFFEMGGSSIKAIQLIGRLGKDLNTTIPIVKFFDKPTIAGFAQVLSNEYKDAVEKRFDKDPDPAEPSRLTRQTDVRNVKEASRADLDKTGAGHPIAIVGMACRLPGADNIDKFWHNVKSGVSSIISVQADDLRAAGLDPEILKDPMYINVCAYLQDADCFDAAFFGYFRNEAEMISPQHRIFLETACAALEHAGYHSENYDGSIGVFGGVARDNYLTDYIAKVKEKNAPINEYLITLGNDKDYPATRVSYKLNLKGPAINVQTACSSSGVAVHWACRSLFAGDCDMALAGGCRVLFPIKGGYWRFEGSPLSPSGQVRAFDADADGFIRGSGAGFIVLKRLEDAIADRDTIHAVIRGTAVNNDGADKIGYTAPSISGQAKVISAAIQKSGLSADAISYVEAHGTGTQLGDPIEIEGLTKAFRETTDKKQYCAIGSVKTNIGHLDAGACVTGIIKTVLALKHQLLPPSLNYRRPNPQIDFENSPFYVSVKLSEWKRNGRPRCAGVSSFGIGGTNVHIILEEASPLEQDTKEIVAKASDSVELICLSAKTETALEKATENLNTHLNRHKQINIADVAYTLQVGRKEHSYRRFISARGRGEAMAVMENRTFGTGVLFEDSEAPQIVFMFAAPNDLYVNMGKQLYDREPVFKSTLEACAEMLLPILNKDIRHLLYPDFAGDHLSAGGLTDAQTNRAITFAFALAQANVLKRWGVFPQAVTGAGAGGIAAAVLTDVFSFEEGVRMTARYDRKQFGQITFSPPRVPFLSLQTGEVIPAEEIMDPAFWIQISESAPDLGPWGDSLRNDKNRIVIDAGCNYDDLLESMGYLWVSGGKIDWRAFYGNAERNHIPLPTYPFERKRFWIGPDTIGEPDGDSPADRTIEDAVKDDVCQPSTENEHKKESKMVQVNTSIKEKAIQLLIGMIDEVTGEEIAVDRVDANFMELGFDSLLLTQITQAIINQFGIDITFRQLIEDYQTPGSLAEFLMDRLPPEKIGVEPAIVPEIKRKPTSEADSPEVISAESDIPVLPSAALDLEPAFIERIFKQQLDTVSQVISRQVDALTGQTQNRPAQKVSGAPKADLPMGSHANADQKSGRPTVRKDFVGPKLRIAKEDKNTLSDRQRNHLSKLIQKYTEKTKKSKAYAQEHRTVLADPRAVAGFRPYLKELIYPIVVERSHGSKLWDIDGNEYVDMLNGFGSNFFGHSSPFIIKAVHEQMQQGFEIGPQHPLAGEVAKLILEFTRLDRVAFCNTGSEAVLGALRLARTVTARSKVVIFEGAYHGIFDEVIVRGTRKLRSLPAAPGILPASVENIVVLEYGSEEALAYIRENAKELAAVLIEPVQSRLPELQPKAFLHEVRQITRASNTAFIFDEVVTGFRSCPGGAQEIFDIEADIATYGKVLGGGMSIGVISGKKAYMDALDGGYWQYGDASFPEVGVTYFAGTFVRHPPVLAAARAALLYMKEKGPDLQRRLNQKTADFVAELNAYFTQNQIPMEMTSFSSVIRVGFTEDVVGGELLYIHLRERGVHIWAGRPVYLSIAHSDDDFKFVADAFRQSVSEMQKGGFLPGSGEQNFSGQTGQSGQPGRSRSQAPPMTGARLGKGPDGNPAWFVPDPNRPGKYLKIRDKK